MDEIKTKQQIVEKIKSSSKILVTVSNDPSVDALSAALALTLLLDKQEKYATAIFSGETPPAIAFLEPEKTFDDTTDSLRDFIIALNKEKADHLRYKVVDNAVKIFITPYKTTITEDDLEFSQGDYNVELVIALGVNNQDHLDAALSNHGQILHNASIITVTAGDQTSNLGGVDWHDAGASSLSEMIAGLAEALKDDKKKSLLDGPIATALLTGIVAETDRFSNEHTTSKAMSVASSLMGAGADQQLIANELQAVQAIEVTTPDDETSSDNDTPDEKPVDDSLGSLTISKEKDGESESGDTFSVSHEGETLADLDKRVRGEEEAKERVADEVEALQERARKEEEAEEAAADVAVAEPMNEDDAPTLGGALNATTEQAADDARHEAEKDRNRTLLSHSYLGGDNPAAPGAVAVSEVPDPNEPVHSAYAIDDVETTTEPPTSPEQPAPVEQSVQAEPSAPTIGERVIQPLTSEPTPVFAPEPTVAAEQIAGPAPQALEPTPADLGLPLPPPIPDFSQLNTTGMPAPAVPPVAIPLPSTPQPERLGDILAPEPFAAAPDLAPAPALPPAVPQFTPAVEPAYAPPSELPPVLQPAPEPAPADPGQFQIPPAQ